MHEKMKRERGAHELSADRGVHDDQKHPIEEVAQTERHPMMTRRNFLLGSGAVATGFIATDYFHGHTMLGRLLNDSISGQYDYDSLVSESKSYLKDRYGIRLAMGEDADEIAGDPVALLNYRNTIRTIVEEFSKYPPEMFLNELRGRVIDLRIVNDLKNRRKNPTHLNTRIIGGLTAYAKDGAKMIAINASASLEYQRRIIHHELNHAFTHRNRFEHHKSWQTLHAGMTSRPYRQLREGMDPHAMSREGYFLTNYAGTTPFEDQAVCAEWMMIPLLNAAFVDRIRDSKDPRVRAILNAKYNLVKKNYAEWSNGKINEEFWKNIYEHGIRERGLILRTR